MYILRLAILSLSEAPADYQKSSILYDGIEVTIRSRFNKKMVSGDKQYFKPHFGVLALARIDRKDLTEDGDILILPQKIIKKCNQVIEAYCDSLSVAFNAKRTITSPSRCARLVPENQEDEIYLAKFRDYKVLNKSALLLNTVPNLPHDLVTRCSDRIDGLRLLSSAISSETPIGKFREFVRLYELAFSQPFTNLDKKLAQFLGSSSKLSRGDIKNWIRLRHPSTHADSRQTKTIAFDVDIIAHVTAMEVAAYDLLLNKVNWGKNCAKKRSDVNVWVVSGRIRAQVLDEFLAFYMNANVVNITCVEWPLKQYSAPEHDSTKVV